jgi:DNA-damage-inducible protein D
MDKALMQIQESLESIKKINNNLEYWSARDLMPFLGYSTWRQFFEVIEKAKEACKTSGNQVSDHFAGASKMVLTGSGAQREVVDFLLTRFACYLIAQNGDPRKPQIALAQTYFATQTRRQELMEERELQDKRLESRAKLKDTENKIEGTVYERGIRTGVEFGSFKNRHIEALYGGVSAIDLKKKKGIPPTRALADFDTDVELRAKDFALSMTDHNIKQKNLRGHYQMTEEVVKNSKATRQTLLSRGIRPENLKAQADLKLVASRRSKELKAIEERKNLK